jgi:ABC-type dipeptide/oligopeptide/nickel transport system permease subunit
MSSGPEVFVASELGAAAGYRAPWGRAPRRLFRQPVTVAAIVILIAVFVLGALGPTLAPQGPNSINLDPRWQNHAPMLSGWHLFGTDNIGRDILVRTIWGLYTSEQTALLAALLATIVAVAFGGFAGYRGGWLDALVMRIGDLITTFPALMVLLAAYVFLQPVTVLKATLVLTLYLWIPAARVLRPHFAALHDAEFIHAARSLGASGTRIFFRHMLPNASTPIIIASTALLGQVIMLEATVEFFGLGVSSLVKPTLGNLIGDVTQSGIGVFNEIGLGWWTWACPATVLVLILLCANLAGDGIAEALNPSRP